MLHFTSHTAVANAPDTLSFSAGFKAEGHGPAIVLLHSSMGSKSQWRTLMEHMRATHRLIAIDLHGYGDTPMPACPENFSLADEMRLVQSILDCVLGPEERFHLVGHSFGGGVALRLAHAHPERVRSLCLYEPTAFHLLGGDHPALDEVRAVARATEEGMRSGERHHATGMFIDYWGGEGSFAALPSSRQTLFTSLLPKVPLDFRALIGDPHRERDYRRIDAPSCLITGRSSPDCAQAIAALLSDTLRDSELHEIDAGHMGPLTHPAVVNPLVDGFIRRIEARPGESRLRIRA